MTFRTSRFAGTAAAIGVAGVLIAGCGSSSTNSSSASAGGGLNLGLGSSTSTSTSGGGGSSDACSLLDAGLASSLAGTAVTKFSGAGLPTGAAAGFGANSCIYTSTQSGAGAELFVSNFPSTAVAQAAIDGALSAQSKSGGQNTSLSGIGDRAAQYLDQKGTVAIVFAKGSTLVVLVVHNSSSVDAGKVKDAASQIANKL